MPRGGVSVKFSPQALAAVALLAAHEPILDVLLAPAPLAPQRHPFTPSATPPPMDMGNLCGVETLIPRKADNGRVLPRVAVEVRRGGLEPARGGRRYAGLTRLLRQRGRTRAGW